ncbi:MAG: glycoside hydrolase family 28 protein [Muribaculaceae bacterium]|nr:glycoside hydrolase family 28 protein [Muribaculaceae bacterium]
MKKTIILMALCLATLMVKGAGYDSYYEGLPIELARVSPVTFPDRHASLTDFGAKGDGITLCTQAFAKGIETLSEQGGGVLEIPAGVWLTGPIELKSNICLNLDKNAIVLFSPDKSLYIDPAPKARRVLPGITATRCTNIGITGSGIIDGRGHEWRPVKRGKVSDVEWKAYKAQGAEVTPKGDLMYQWNSRYGYPNVADNPKKQEGMRNDLFRVFNCEGVLLQGVTFQNAPKFHLHPFNSRNVIIDGVTVRAPWNAQNADAIDISDCHRVLIVNSTIDAGDDGFCLKSGEYKKGALVNGCEDILIRRCTAFHGHGGFVIGSEDICDMTRIVCTDCCMSGTDMGLRFKSAIGRGGKTKDLYLYNIVMNDIISEAIGFECSYADKPAGRENDTETQKELVNVPEFKDIHIYDITCNGCATAIAASGIEGMKCVYDIEISNSTFVYRDRATEIDQATTQIELQNVTLIKEGDTQK